MKEQRPTWNEVAHFIGGMLAGCIITLLPLILLTLTL